MHKKLQADNLAGGYRSNIQMANKARRLIDFNQARNIQTCKNNKIKILVDVGNPHP
jgi:hypothetical protein